MQEKYNSKVIAYYFRNKDNGWKKFSTKIIFENGKEIVEAFDKNIYMRGFLRNVFLRRSCYLCSSNNFTSKSDITLADYWGVDVEDAGFDDDKGASLVMINSNEGLKMINSLSDELTLKECDLSRAISYNKAIVSPAFTNKNRDRFFSDMDKEDITKTIEDNLFDE